MNRTFPIPGNNELIENTFVRFCFKFKPELQQQVTNAML